MIESQVGYFCLFCFVWYLYVKHESLNQYYLMLKSVEVQALLWEMMV